MQDRYENQGPKKGKNKGRAFAALLLAGGLIGGSASMAMAAPTAPTDKIESTSITLSQAENAIDYWTPERMENAKSADSLTNGKATSNAPLKAGKSKKIAGQDAKMRNENANKPKRGSAVSPVSHIGKVFFTLGGSDYVCSGNSVVSANESTVSTAGHCANEGPGAFATRWVFVPAYENGNAPYGSFAATELVAPTQWSNGGDISYDTAFAVVTDNSGVSLADQVGASGVAFNQARGLSYTAFGYPAASPFNGETLQSCSGRATADPYGQSQSQGIPCDMTGGSSGGPWFLGGSDGYQNSVNSFGYSGVRNTMFGPYWGSVVEQAYNAAQN
ncbi:trypsin-like serine peptidase [Glutamicibacter arilaitensis]|uniref:trypsin-like serine peptidase n=1 Tax=Glutamicibacter arilaitensis TaxID=256701 RepID=UPI00384B7B9B